MGRPSPRHDRFPALSHPACGTSLNEKQGHDVRSMTEEQHRDCDRPDTGLLAATMSILGTIFGGAALAVFVVRLVGA